MSENLPDITPDQPPAPPENQRELVVSGEEVYLPESGRIVPGGAEFEKIIAEVLPDYAPALSEEALCRPKGYSLLAALLILLLLGGVATALFILRPQVDLQTTAILVPKPKKTSYSGEFSREYKEAMQMIKNQQFATAREFMSPMIDQLLERGGNQGENTPIFYAYFSLFDRLSWDYRAREQLKRLIALDSDHYQWKLFKILSHPALSCANRFPDEYHLDFQAEPLIATLAEIDDLRQLHHDDAEVVKILDLCKCYLDLQLWRMKNFPKVDDKNGEADREEAYRIASKYPKNQSFVDIRNYIVNRLLQDGTSGRYVFNGKIYWSEKHLRQALLDIKREAAGEEVKK